MNPAPELELLLIRHGESQYNRDGTGGIDSPLTEVGIDQARRLATFIPLHFKIGVLYTSTMIRARQTAEIIAPWLGLPLLYDAELCESDYDLAEDLAHLPDPADVLAGAPLTPALVSPRYVEFQARVVCVFQKIIRAHPANTIAVVTHGGVMATLLRTIFGGHHVSFYQENTGLTLLRWHNARWYLVFSNRVEHLSQ